ncbi:MAG: helix-turn-helix domain-containing protein [Pseudomonadota bacterium]
MTRQVLDHVEHHFDGPFEAWREHVGIVFDAAPMFSPDNTGRYSSRMYVTHYGGIERAEYDAVMIRHSEHHTDAVSGLVSIGRYLKGGPIALRQNTSSDAFARTVTIFDQSQPYESIHGPSIIQNVYLFKSALGLSDSEKVRFRVLRPGQPAADLLNTALDRLFDAHESHSPVFYDDVLLRFLASVRVAIKPEISGRDIRRRARDALRELIVDYLQQNLADPDLGPAVVLNKFGVSRATLYRMFEQYGGLGTYISNQRLLRATYDLSQVEPARGLIRRTAERWGFSSGVQFNRTIRNTFGTSPGELFEAPLEQLNTLPDFDYLNSFLNRQPTALEENA